jgi:hypothetical protein
MPGCLQSCAALTGNWSASLVLPEPDPPTSSIVRLCGNPPPLISSKRVKPAGALVDTFTKVRSGVYDVSFRKEHKKPARIREMAFNADNNRADPKSSKHALEGSCSSQILHRYVHSSCLTLNKFERMYRAARRHGCPECAELRSAFTNLRKDVPLASSTLIEKLGTATTQVPVV